MAELNAYQKAVQTIESVHGPRHVRITVGGKDAAEGQEERATEIQVDHVGVFAGKTLAEAVKAATAKK